MSDVGAAQAALAAGPEAARPVALRQLVAAVKFDSRNLSPVLAATLAKTCLAPRPSTGESAPFETFTEGVALLQVLLKATVSQHAWRDASVGLLAAPPALVGALFECIISPCRGLLSDPTLDGSKDGRVKPVAEAMKAVFDLLPDHKHTDLPQEPQLVQPLESLCVALIDVCTAEHLRPGDNFPVMNVTWRLLSRCAAILPLLPGATCSSCASTSDAPFCLPQAIFRCLLLPLGAACEALAAAEPHGGAGAPNGAAAAGTHELPPPATDTPTPSDKVSMFYCDRLKSLLSTYAPWLAAEASRRSAIAVELSRALAHAYARLLPLPPLWLPNLRQSRRKIRSMLDTSVLTMLTVVSGREAEAAQHGAAPPPSTAVDVPCAVLDHWTLLAAATESPLTAYGFSQLLLAAMRVTTTSARLTAGSAALQRRVVASALPAWLELLPRSYTALLAPSDRHGRPPPHVARPHRLITPVLSEMCALASGAPVGARIPLLEGLVTGSCAAHPLTQRVAAELWPYALRPLPSSEAVQWVSTCLLAASRLEAHAPGSEHLRRGLLALVASTCAGRSLPEAEAATMLSRLASPLTGEPLGGDDGRGGQPPHQPTTTSAQDEPVRAAVAVELLEALAVCAPSPSPSDSEGLPPTVCMSGVAPAHTDAAAEGASRWRSVAAILERCGAARWLSAVSSSVQRSMSSHDGSRAAHTALCLRGVSALLLLWPRGESLPSGVADSLPDVLRSAVAAPSAADTPARTLLTRALETASAAMGWFEPPHVLSLLHAVSQVLLPQNVLPGGTGAAAVAMDSACLAALCDMLRSVLRRRGAAREQQQMGQIVAALICLVLDLAFADDATHDSLKSGASAKDRDERCAVRVKAVDVAAAFIMGGSADAMHVQRVQQAVARPAVMPLLTAHLQKLSECQTEAGAVAAASRIEFATPEELDMQSAAAAELATTATAANEDCASVSASSFERAKRIKREGTPRIEAAERGLGLLRGGLQALQEAAAQAGGNGRALARYQAQLKEHLQQLDALVLSTQHT